MEMPPPAACRRGEAQDFCTATHQKFYCCRAWSSTLVRYVTKYNDQERKKPRPSPPDGHLRPTAPQAARKGEKRNGGEVYFIGNEGEGEGEGEGESGITTRGVVHNGEQQIEGERGTVACGELGLHSQSILAFPSGRVGWSRWLADSKRLLEIHAMP
ncbi:hypothetical protein VTK26DRAFT_7547 [Humicola hyalothermophila]